MKTYDYFTIGELYQIADSVPFLTFNIDYNKTYSRYTDVYLIKGDILFLLEYTKNKNKNIVLKFLNKKQVLYYQSSWFNLTKLFHKI